MSIDRITGLATGMDTDAIIKKLMDANKVPLTKLEKSETKVEWQRQALLDINSKMLTFRTTTLDMKLQGTYKMYNATSSSASDVTASATTDAEEGTYGICVEKLATKTKLSGTVRDDSLRGSTVYNDTLNLSGKEFKITFNGETKTVSFDNNEDYNFSDDSVAAEDITRMLQAKIDDVFGANQIEVTASGDFWPEYEFSFTPTSTAISKNIVLGKGAEGKDALAVMGFADGTTNVFDRSRKLSDIALADFNGDTMTLCVNNKEFTFTKDQSINDVITTINKDVDADVTIAYDEMNKRFSIERDTSGEGRQLTLKDAASLVDAPTYSGTAFWGALGINPRNSATNGENAVIYVTTPDGRRTGAMEVTSNNFTYKGISMTLIKADPTKEVSITVEKDVDGIYKKIENFVNSYNDMLTTLNKAYKEEATGYEPLTDEEREGLSETQEEQWETKAKEGILRRDTTIGSAITSMRSAVTSAVNGLDIDSLFKIGISTSSYDSVNSENNGKLVINEDKLKQAIKDDINGVADLFSATPKQIQGNKLDNEVINLTDQSFSVTYGGTTKAIELDGAFNLADGKERSNFEDYMKSKFEAAFGTGAVSVSYSGGKILFNSLRNVGLTFNSTSTDPLERDNALESFGLQDGAKYDPTQRGFAVQIYDIATTTMSNIVDKAGATATIVDSSVLGKKLDKIKDSIDSLEDKLQRLEDRYYNQFAAMEDAISKMNSQSSSLTSMLSGS